MARNENPARVKDGRPRPGRARRYAVQAALVRHLRAGYNGVVSHPDPAVARIPESIRPLVWDTDPDSLDPARHPHYMMERVLELGRPEACRWLFDYYGRDRVRDFLRTDGPRRLSLRALNYWAFRLDIEERECLMTSCLVNRNPPWNT